MTALELAAAQTQTSSLRTRCEAAAAKVTELEAAYARAAAQLAAGSVGADVVRRLRDELADARACSSGLETLLAESETQLAERLEEERCRADKENRERRARELEQLRALGTEQVDSIFELYNLLVAAIAALDDTRAALAEKFADLGGVSEAGRLHQRVTINPAGNGEPWRRLYEAGWRERPPVAGGPVRLVATSMRPPG